jgi:hypothetical protein
MADPITDIDSFKHFIRVRTRQIWEERHIPYYLSFVAVDLKKLGVDYRNFIGPLRLSQWASTTEFPETKFLTHPSKKAQVGFVPADVNFSFSNDEDTAKSTAPFGAAHKRGRALMQFVENLAKLPDGAVDDFSVPAKTLIALLKN